MQLLPLRKDGGVGEPVGCALHGVLEVPNGVLWWAT